jgi:hypothetical protein
MPVLGVGDDRIYGDHDRTSTNRHRTGLRLALAACWAGDTSVVTKLYGSPGRCPVLVTSSTGCPSGTLSSPPRRLNPWIGPTASDGAVQRVGDGG